MFPPRGISPIPTIGAVEVPARHDLRTDYAYGTAILGDNSTERNVLWMMSYSRGRVYLNHSGQTPVQFLTLRATELAFCFDGDMNVVLVYRYGGIFYIYRYDSELNDYITETLGTSEEIRTVRAVYDLKDPSLQTNAEAMIFYFRGYDLCRLSEFTDYKNEEVLETYDKLLYIDQVSYNEFHRLQLKVYQLVDDLTTASDPISSNVVAEPIIISCDGALDMSGIFATSDKLDVELNGVSLDTRNLSLTQLKSLLLTYGIAMTILDDSTTDVLELTTTRATFDYEITSEQHTVISSVELGSGSLPNGIQLVDGVLTGTATTLGVFNFTVVITTELKEVFEKKIQITVGG